jgi:predicted TIM-barrel fold metal-dependent hydrolase
MIIDSHCHAWAYWPYRPPVPDPESRGRIEQLLHEMDLAGVDRAVLICAGIDHNPENNAYVFDAARRHGGRIVQFADIDGRWLPSHHTAGAARRLRDAAERFQLVGFTHYLHEGADASWLLGDEGNAFVKTAADLNLILSLACGPTQMKVVMELARRFPSLPILCHHFARVRSDLPRAEGGLDLVLAAAERPNIHIKVSGFGYGVARGWDFPCRGMIEVFREIHARFGAERMCWGSDYPVVRRYMTYRQSLEIVRTHCDFIGKDDLDQILGGTIDRLLRNAGRG